MFVEFSIRPVRQPLLEHVGNHPDPLDRSSRDDRPPSLSACIEGTWDEVVEAIRGWQQALSNGQPRVVTTIVIVEDHLADRMKRWPRCLDERIPAAHGPGDQSGRSVRRIPISV